MKINVGRTIPEQFQLDLQLEYEAVARLNAGIEVVRAKDDNGTRALLEHILTDEEEHVDWLEAQLQQIKDIGVENYLSQQIEE
jgi:bacterioferritin